MDPIDFYFDFASPYGFLAAMQVGAIARPVRWRPFLLGAVYKKFGQSPLEHPLKREYVIKVDAPRMARRLGLDLQVPADFPNHSLPPARLFYWIEAQDPAKAAEFAKAAYRAFWIDGRSTSDPAVAVSTAVSLGFAQDAVNAGLQNPSIKQRLVRATDEAIDRGVFGSPFFFVDGEPFWGSDRLDMLVALA
jgi:2-hydroxychromene-2-carboxylate isomerase